MKFEWLQIEENENISDGFFETWRAPVMGGWIVLTKYF